MDVERWTFVIFFRLFSKRSRSGDLNFIRFLIPSGIKGSSAVIIQNYSLFRSIIGKGLFDEYKSKLKKS